eukprot:TRINITY_DN21126_c0_g1_i2.p1 TRINITY_DN21126_c0_g1~~TRINITY_DN21126_c0_g1_i2.p1  ORF type:complete len:146 (-),score=21.66 TRINITY_DN21126_c0_g1_i2:70-507(-)
MHPEDFSINRQTVYQWQSEYETWLLTHMPIEGAHAVCPPGLLILIPELAHMLAQSPELVRSRHMISPRCQPKESKSALDGLLQLPLPLPQWNQQLLALTQTLLHLEKEHGMPPTLSLIHISEPTRLLSISYAVFCLKKKKKKSIK